MEGKPARTQLVTVKSPSESQPLHSATSAKRCPGATPVKRYRGPPRSTFKSPVLASSKAKSESAPVTAASLVEDVDKLQAEYRQSKAEAEELEKTYDIKELNLYIDLFHEYNEVKDTTQMLLGRIAEVRGTTVRQLHEEYSLDPAD